MGDKWKNIVVIFNANKKMVTVDVPKGKWKIVLDGENINEKKPRDFNGSQYNVPPIGAVILVE